MASGLAIASSAIVGAQLAPAGLFGAAPAASPSPSSSPAPRRRRSLLGSGPIIFTGTGNYDLGARENARNGQGLSQNTYQTNLSMGLSRRTEQAVFGITEGVGYGQGSTSYGQLQAGYRTPSYELDFGAVSGATGTQLQLGGFTRGVRYVKPRPHGTLELIAAAAFQQDNTGFRALGIRRSYLGKRSTLSVTAFDERALKGSARNTIADISYSRYGQSGSATAEVALANPHGVALAGDGPEVAFGFAATRAGRTGFASFSAQFEPAGFASLNTVSLPGANADLLLRHDLFRTSSLSVDIGADRSVSQGSIQADHRLTGTFTTSVHGVNMTFLQTLSSSSGANEITQNRSTGATFAETILGTQFSESFQKTGTSGSSGDASQGQVAFSESRRLFGGYFGMGQSRGHSSSGGATGTFAENDYSFTQTLGHRRNLDLTLGYTDVTQTTTGITTPTETTTVALTRRLSRVVAVRASLARIHQGGVTPGNASAFSIDLVGPFNLGAAQTLGRINPNLPATIRGRVYAIASQQAYGAQAQSGYGNVLIVLDGTQTERTDSSGEYEFHFVKPGLHSVAIEVASLQAGLVADRQLQSFRIQGGQTQEINFGVGNFAGVAGQLSTDFNGRRVGIPDVVIVIDDLLRTVTGPDGRYALGGLSQGSHRVAVDLATLPSNAALDGSYADKTVQMMNGVVTRVDFAAQRLGSIAGNVLYAPEGGFGDLRGAKDVYVVANPGDHAAITDPDGAFLIDNLPPGTYTVTLDKDTLPDGEDVIQGPDDPINVPPEAKIEGISFKLGSQAKEVVFTFNGAHKTMLQISTDLSPAPPGALVHVSVRGVPKQATGVKLESDNFGQQALVHEGDLWTGAILVPAAIAKGDYALSASAVGANATGDAYITVDPRVPLISVRIAPAHPSPGHTIRVVAHIDAPASEGDEIHFPDGYAITLPKPNGRVFAFNMRLWLHGFPYTGSLVTKGKLVFPFYLR